MPLDPTKFFGLPSCDLEAAEVVILPLPLEATVTCGTGTWRAPRAILEASCQVELFDEETGVDFSRAAADPHPPRAAARRQPGGLSGGHGAAGGRHAAASSCWPWAANTR